jgi:hypothetical protein
VKIYEVEIQVIYLFRVEADDPQGATMIAQMDLSDGKKPVWKEMITTVAEELEPGKIPESESVQRPPPGLINPQPPTK